MFTISERKLNIVVKAVQRHRWHMSRQDIKDFMLGDWSEGEDHQKWLDNVSSLELVDWVVQCNR